MKKPPPDEPGGDRKLRADHSPPSLSSGPRPVHPVDQPDRPTSAESDFGDLDPDLDDLDDSDFGDLDPDRPTPAESDLDDPGLDPGWDDPDLDLEGDAYLAGPGSTFEDGRYERALEVLSTLIPSAKIIDARSLFRDLHEDRECWSSLPYGIDRLVFITADDGTIGWRVYGEVYDAQEISLPVHLLDLESIELVPARELHLVSTALVFRDKASWTCSHYVFRRWPFELFVVLAGFLKHFRRKAA